MVTCEQLQGSVCAIPTPFEESQNKIDARSVRRLCDYLIQKGIDGILVAGTVGEGLLLTLQEKKYLIELVIKEVHGRIPVGAQCGMLNDRETVELARHVKKVGGNGAVILVPYFYPMDRISLKQYYLKIAKEVKEFPLYIYNIPSHTGNQIEPELVGELADKIPNLQGMKYSDCDLFQLRRYIEKLPGKSVLIGCDFMILDALLMGAKGIVSGTIVSFPEVFTDLLKVFRENDLIKSKWYQNQIRDLLSDLEKLPYVPLYKQILAWKHIIKSPVCRSPWRGLRRSELSQLRTVFEKFYKEGGEKK